MMENKYLKALDRIRRDLPFPVNWTEEDKEHYKTIVEALEKQIPENEATEATKIGDYTCPRCGNVVNVTHQYCCICGQAIKWEGVE